MAAGVQCTARAPLFFPFPHHPPSPFPVLTAAHPCRGSWAGSCHSVLLATHRHSPRAGLGPQPSSEPAQGPVRVGLTGPEALLWTQSAPQSCPSLSRTKWSPFLLPLRCARAVVPGLRVQEPQCHRAHRCGGCCFWPPHLQNPLSCTFLHT